MMQIEFRNEWKENKETDDGITIGTLFGIIFYKDEESIAVIFLVFGLGLVFCF